jgi:hypothetical protein
MIASQREANTVILESDRRLIQKRDLASHTQSLFRLGDQLRRQAHTLKKRRRRRFRGARQPGGKGPPCAIGIEAKSCSEFRAEELRLLILEPPAGAIATTMAATNKCLAESNKSDAGGKATKKRIRRSRISTGH